MFLYGLKHSAQKIYAAFSGISGILSLLVLFATIMDPTSEFRVIRITVISIFSILLFTSSFALFYDKRWGRVTLSIALHLLIIGLFILFILLIKEFGFENKDIPAIIAGFGLISIISTIFLVLISILHSEQFSKDILSVEIKAENEITPKEIKKGSNIKLFLFGFFSCLLPLAITTVILVVILAVEIYYEAKLPDEDEVVYLDTKIEKGGYNDCKLNPEMLKTRKIYLNKHINAITTENIVENIMILNERDSTKDIDLYINSQGGALKDAYAIINTMKLTKAKVNTYAIGKCSSAALHIFINATGKRYAFENSSFFFHDVYLNQDNSKYSDFKINRAIFMDEFRKNTKIPEDWYKKGTEKNFNAMHALEFGIVDSIIK